MRYFINILLLIFFANLLFSQNNNWLPSGLPTNLFGRELSCFYVDTTQNELYIGSVLKSWYSWEHQTIAKYDGNSWDTLGDFDWKVRTMINYQGNLIVGGEFTKVNGVQVSHITIYNGNSWVNIGNFDYPVINLKIIEDTLYAMGFFSQVDSIPVNGIAKWDGNTWSNVFSFPSCDYPPWASDIVKYKGNYYVAGNFNIQQKNIRDIAMYKNNTWQSVGQGFFGGFNAINQMLVYKDELYAAGLIKKTDGNIGSGIQKWDGTSWTEPGTSLQDVNNSYNSNIQIHGMTIYKNELYVCGGFYYAGNVPAFTLAKWDGKRWCGFGTTNILTGYGTDIAFFNDTLYYNTGEDTLNGQFTNYLLKYNGTLLADTCSTPLSINESIALNKNNIHIFPNPTQNHLNIQLNKQTSKNLKIQLYDIVGKLIETYIFENSQSINKIDISELKAGVYFVKVSVYDGEFVLDKFVKL